ncbi:hypothetical protein CYY_003678 [Polysphondylium violaceum]|uniref:O-methyltransferase family 3 protein n=1 Tax=Polysphondylium violaceum TaxID=133409 RepID=A0A8J4Q6J2_9MYCE|nr:hypothetical protein CYY_003678 [Polysphondylium violaceum]
MSISSYSGDHVKTLISDRNLNYLIEKCLPAFHPAQIELQNVSQQHARAIMVTSPEQVSFFQFLLRVLNAKKVIEVGVFTGYCTLAMALALPDDGKVVGCDISTEFTDIGKPYWEKAGVDKKIDLRIQPATKTLKDLINAGESGTYDFIFIDADKVSYVEYYSLAYQLIRPGGIIALDNILFHGYVSKEEINDDNTVAIRKVNEIVQQDGRVYSTSLPVADGITLVTKK